MQRTISFILLVVVLICSLTACSSTPKTSQPANSGVGSTPISIATYEETLDNAGIANLINGKIIAALNWGIKPEIAEQAINEGYGQIVANFRIQDMLFVDSLTDGLLMLRSGKVDVLDFPAFNSRYLAQRNRDLFVYNTDGWKSSTHILFSLALKDQFEKVNSAVKAMNQDGAMQKLKEKWILNLPVGEEPSGGAIQRIEGAATLKVGISGDEPPLDYIAADGTPGGFNVAMLSEISQRSGLNIEMVTVNSGARFAALKSGKIDAFLWQTGDISDLGAVAPVTETMKLGDAEFLKTESYLETNDTALVLKK
jgi:ABC-type amino acid transport substrate-binding protein